MKGKRYTTEDKIRILREPPKPFDELFNGHLTRIGFIRPPSKLQGFGKLSACEVRSPIFNRKNVPAVTNSPCNCLLYRRIIAK